MNDQIEIRILDLGYMTFLKKELVATPNPQEMIYSPALAILIKHPTAGYILYDTGNDADWQNSYSEAMKTTYPITKLITIEEALKKEGLSVNDIDTLILSHLHFDHAGGMKYFANTKAGAHTIVSDAELQEVMNTVPQAENQTIGAFIGKLFLNIPGVQYEPLKEETEIAPGITLFIQRCHTPGLIGLRVQLKDRTVIFMGDTVYTGEAYQKELPPGGSINKTNDEFYANLKRLKEMEKEFHAEVFYGHDFEQAKEWQEKGWIQ